MVSCFFFFQAEDGIRDHCVTGVQTCALPICNHSNASRSVKPKPSSAARNGKPGNGKLSAGKSGAVSAQAPIQMNDHGIPDWRLERPDFEVFEVGNGPEVHYEIRGNLKTPVPPIRESKYLNKQQCLEIHRWMVMNRLMEQALDRNSTH